MKKILLAMLALLFVMGCQTTGDAGAADMAAADAIPKDTDKEVKADEPVYILNGSFDENTGYWECDASGGSAGFAVVDGELEVQVDRAGSDTWSVGLYQPAVNIRKGYEYTVTFKARALAERNILAYIGEGQAPWRTYGGDTTNGFTLTDVMTEYSYTFTAGSTDKNSKMCFSFGRVKGENNTWIYIDDITMTEVAPE